MADSNSVRSKRKREKKSANGYKKKEAWIINKPQCEKEFESMVQSLNSKHKTE